MQREVPKVANEAHLREYGHSGGAGLVLGCEVRGNCWTDRLT